MSIKRDEHTPRLVADVGGTNARFGLVLGPARCVEHVQVLPTADHPSLQHATHQYLAGVGALGTQVREAAIGIANPVLGDRIAMTNHDWSFSIREMQAAMGWTRFVVMNDFAALAHALPLLPADELQAVGGGTPRPHAPRLLIGPGTGLGVSALVPTGAQHKAIEGEGGHVSFAPVSDEEVALLAFMRGRFERVSAERLLSGSGLSYIHAFVSGQPSARDLDVDALRHPGEITAGALAGTNAHDVRAVDLFCALLGTVASDFALMLGAMGGVFIGGGIVPRLGDYFARSPFRARFEDKGRFAHYLADIPVHVIHSPQPALIGLAAALNQPPR